jgi:hypothetical protein
MYKIGKLIGFDKDTNLDFAIQERDWIEEYKNIY